MYWRNKMKRCLNCNKILQTNKNYCNSNCWNKHHREECKNARKKWHENNIEHHREYHRRYMKEWNKKNPEKCRNAWKNWYENNIEHHREYTNEWRKKNPEKYKESKRKQHQHEMINQTEKWKARATGYLFRGNKCLKCGSIENLEFHHTNYKLQEGITLCMPCHRQLHKEEQNEN